MFGKKTEDGYVEVLDGIKIKTINYGEHSLMTEFLLAKGSLLVEHSHPHEQSGYLVKGQIKLSIGEKSKVLGPGDSWNVPPNVKHKADILEDSIAVEVFSPCREEYKRFLNSDDIYQ